MGQPGLSTSPNCPQAQQIHDYWKPKLNSYCQSCYQCAELEIRQCILLNSQDPLMKKDALVNSKILISTLREWDKKGEKIDDRCRTMMGSFSSSTFDGVAEDDIGYKVAEYNNLINQFENAYAFENFDGLSNMLQQLKELSDEIYPDGSIELQQQYEAVYSYNEANKPYPQGDALLSRYERAIRKTLNLMSRAMKGDASALEQMMSVSSELIDVSVKLGESAQYLNEYQIDKMTKLTEFYTNAIMQIAQ